MAKDNRYFGSKDGKDCANILLAKAESWTNSLDTCGYLEKLRTMWCFFHGSFYNDGSEGHQISFAGEQGELVRLPVNHIRNLGSHMITMTTSNRPSMEARSVNTDYKSVSQTKLANGILEYYMREKRLEAILKNAVENAVVLGAGFIKMEWNATTGEIYDYFQDDETGEPDPERPIYEGDLEFTNLSPFDIVFDGTKENHNHDWYLVRTFKNKYDLAVKYPEFEDKIVNLQTKSDIQRYRVGITNLVDETDDIPVYEFYHKKTDVLPNGRYMLFLDNSIILQDIGLPYRSIPIFRVSSGDILGTPYGYTPLFDIMPIQEALNSLYSTILTNQNATGVQNFWTKPGGQLNVTSLSGALNLIESMEKPEVLELCKTPTEVFRFLEMLERVAETLTAVNSVARGNPAASLQTGAALALVQSQALQFMSGLQSSYVHLIEDVGSGIISILKDYAKVPRMIAIVGKTNRTELKEFVGDDISKISRVYVDVGNPLSRSIAGRMELAAQMMQYQVVTNPKQIIEVLNTGKLEALTEDVQDELDLIKRENETITEGEDPIVTAIDDHAQHIIEHRKVLQDPELRKDPGLVERALGHIQKHIEQLRTVDPALLQMMKQQPLPPIMPPGASPDGMEGNPPPGPLAPPTQGQLGIQQGPDATGNIQMQGGAMESPTNIPKPAKVDANMLVNPELQQQAMGNVRE